MRGLVQTVMARVTADPLYPGERRIPYSGRTAAGVYINGDRSLTNATVWACHRYLTQTMGQLPPRIRRMVRGGGSDEVTSGPVVNLLTWRANPELSPFQFKETLTGWAVLRGNGIAEIERDSVGRAIALWPIHPDRVEFRRDVVTGALIYRINNGPYGTVDLESADVFHLRGFGHGPVGLSVVEYAAQSIGWAAATELFGASFFGEGMSFGGVISLKGKGDAGSIKRMRAELEPKHKGPGKAGGWAFVDGDAKVEKITTTPNEAQFVETMQHQVEEICRWFGVPPQKVGHLLRMTFNNVEQLSIEVVVDSITPWCVRFEEEANYKLFGANRSGFFVKLDLKGLLRGDFKSRQEGLQIMRRNGIINGDFWAETEDMPKPGPDGRGDKYIVEGNMTSMERVGEAPPPAVAAPASADDAPPDDDEAQPDEDEDAEIADILTRYPRGADAA